MVRQAHTRAVGLRPMCRATRAAEGAHALLLLRAVHAPVCWQVSHRREGGMPAAAPPSLARLCTGPKQWYGCSACG